MLTFTSVCFYPITAKLHKTLALSLLCITHMKKVLHVFVKHHGGLTKKLGKMFKEKLQQYSLRKDCVVLLRRKIKQGLDLAVPLPQHAVYFYFF